MTLQERYDDAKKAVDALSQERAQIQAALNRNTEQLIRADAQLALLEQLITDEQPAADPPLALVPKRGRKPKEQQAS